MTQQAQAQPQRTFTPSPKDHAPYIKLIKEAIASTSMHPDAIECFGDQIADQIIYTSFLTLKPDEWQSKFQEGTSRATKWAHLPGSFSREIARTLLTPEVQKAVLEIFPSIDRKKYFPNHQEPKPSPKISPTIGTGFNLKISMSLTRAWRLDPRWEKLLPCSKTLFYYLIFRTYRKDTFHKIKQALSRGESYFPWCVTGIKSLEKVLTYHKGSSTRLRHYEACQIKKALRQLWDLGLVHRIFRGLPDRGAGKYHVFLKPIMAARFNKSSIDRKKGIPTRRRRSRMN